MMYTAQLRVMRAANTFGPPLETSSGGPGDHDPDKPHCRRDARCGAMVGQASSGPNEGSEAASSVCSVRVGSKSNSRVPSTSVLSAFHVADDEVRSPPGSEETSVLVGGLVFKQALDPAGQDGLAASLELPAIELRVPRPVPNELGDREVDGWIATEFVDERRSDST